MKSMTGYGSAECVVGNGRIFLEFKSINHRYCDIFLKIPPRMTSLDPLLRKLIQENVERGKIELFLKEKRDIVQTKALSVDVDLARGYQKCINKLKRELRLSEEKVGFFDVVDLEKLVSLEDAEVDYSKYWPQIKKLVTIALGKLDRMKQKEGEFIKKDQKKRLGTLETLLKQIDNKAVSSISRYQMRMKKKLKGAINSTVVPQEKIDAELVHLADKLDVTEELIRLKSHFSQYRQILNSSGSIGRRLDFLLQEMNREINTIGSKASDAAISSNVVNAKAELEKLREQIQNVE